MHQAESRPIIQNHAQSLLSESDIADHAHVKTPSSPTARRRCSWLISLSLLGLAPMASATAPHEPHPIAREVPSDQASLSTEVPRYLRSIAQTNSQDGYLGLVLHTRGGVAFVKRVVPEWPAAEGGLKPGDQLVSVEGVMALAPRLNRALNLLAGAAGTSVEVKVMRPGETEARTVRLVRTASPVPAFQAALPKPTPSPSKLIQEALSRRKPGEDTLLRQMLMAFEKARPGDAPALWLEAIQGLTQQDLPDAQALAINLANEMLTRAPLAEETCSALLVAYPMEDKKGELKAAAGKLRTALKSPPPGVSRELLERARTRAELVEAIGTARSGNVRRGLRKVEPLLSLPHVDLQAFRGDGALMWEAPVRAEDAWISYFDLALSKRMKSHVFSALNAILQYDQPAFAETALSLLPTLDREEVVNLYLTPRFPLPRTSTPYRTLQKNNGEVVNLKELQGQRPGILLWCDTDPHTCEDWRLSLTSVLLEESELDIYTAMIFAAGAEDRAADLSWPTLFAPRTPENPTPLIVLDPDGAVAEAEGPWRNGLEHRVGRTLSALAADPTAGGPFLLDGGISLNQWDLRWSRSDGGGKRPLSAIGFSHTTHATPRTWILGTDGRLEQIEDGQSTIVLDNLTDVSRMWIAELDGDSREELLLYHARDQMLEALDPGGTPRWILPEEQAIELVYPTDINLDGKQEILYTRQGDPKLYCIGPDRSLLWTYTGVGGITAVASGKLEAAASSVVVVTRGGDVVVLDSKGQIQRALKTGVQPDRVAISDLDGDGLGEIVIGNHNIESLLAPDLNGDGLAEVIVQSRGHQILMLNHLGALTSRLSWSQGQPDIRVSDLDGDGHQELAVYTSAMAAILDWAGADAVSTPTGKAKTSGK